MNKDYSAYELDTLAGHERRIAVLETDSQTFKSFVRYVSYAFITVVAALIASNLIHL